MASYNRVILVGNLTRDPELRYIPSGMAVTDIGLAVNDVDKNANGEWVEETTFVDVTLWGRTAEVASEYLSKGSPVFIEGRLKLDTWEEGRPEAVEIEGGLRADADARRPRAAAAGGRMAADAAAGRPASAAANTQYSQRPRPTNLSSDAPPAGEPLQRATIFRFRSMWRAPMPELKSKKSTTVPHRTKRLPQGPHGGVELLLVQPVEHLGKQGDVVEVEPGYAMNYLLPQGLATIATDHHKRMVEKHRAQLEEIEKARLAGLQALAADLGRQSVTIEANANDEGHLYGSVGAAGNRQRPEAQQLPHHRRPGPAEGSAEGTRPVHRQNPPRPRDRGRNEGLGRAVGRRRGRRRTGRKPLGCTGFGLGS